MADVVGDFALTMDELRAVTRFVAECALETLPVFEDAVPQDGRPRAALRRRVMPRYRRAAVGVQPSARPTVR